MLPDVKIITAGAELTQMKRHRPASSIVSQRINFRITPSHQPVSFHLSQFVARSALFLFLSTPFVPHSLPPNPGGLTTLRLMRSTIVNVRFYRYYCSPGRSFIPFFHLANSIRSRTKSASVCFGWVSVDSITDLARLSDAWLATCRQRSYGRQDRPARVPVDPAIPSGEQPKGSASAPTTSDQATATLRRRDDSMTSLNPGQAQPGNRIPRCP